MNNATMTALSGADTAGKAERGRVVDRLVAQLREGIFAGRYVPGQRLIEADLTRELGVSRGPLREAYRLLKAEGLLEITPNRGALVRQLSRREAAELFQIRTALEAMAAAEAARQIDQPGIRTRFEQAIEPIWNDAPRLSGIAYQAENSRFHLAIMDAAGNQQLRELCIRLHLPVIMMQFGNLTTPDILADSVREHRAIAQAILAADPQTADQAVRQHLGRAATITDNMPSHFFRH